MAYLGLISDGIRSVQWEPTSPVAFANRSPWSGRSVAVDTGNRTPWRAIVTPTLATETERANWSYYMAFSKGPVNSFGIAIGEAAQHAFTAGLTMRLAASAGATTLYLEGGTASKLLALGGQYITVTNSRGYYEMVTLAGNLSTDSGGLAEATLITPIRSNVAIAAAVETANPFVQMRMDGPVTGWSVDTGQIYAPGSFACSEVY